MIFNIFLLSLGILVFSLPLVLDSGEPLFGPSSWSFRLWMLLRGLFGGAALLFKFYALEEITMANTTVIILSTPIFVFLFARILLGESFGRYHLLSLMLSIGGIVCASKVHLLFFNENNDEIGSDEIKINSNSSNTTNLTTFFTTSSTTFLTTNENSTENFSPNFTSNFPLINTNNSHSLLGNCYALFSTVLGATVYVLIRKVCVYFYFYFI